MGGQKLMYKALRGKLKPMDNNALIDKILSLPDLKKAAGILGGLMYCMPPVPFIATFLSTTYLKFGAIRMNRDAEDRLEEIARMLDNRDETIKQSLKKTDVEYDI